MLDSTRKKISNTLSGRRLSSERIANIKKSLEGKNTRERKIKASKSRGMNEFMAIRLLDGAIVWRGLLKSECADMLHLNRFKIRDILYGIRKSYKGYTFRYLNPDIVHPDKVLSSREQKKRYTNGRIKNDICFKLRRDLRCRLNKAISINQKTGSAVKNLGCSVEELKFYLESRWQPGMSWENHARDGWHIDHIMPLSSFDLTDPEELKRACHYSNLQPLWAKDNLIKSDNRDEIQRD